MASLWPFWSAPVPPKFPDPPRNLLAYTFSNGADFEASTASSSNSMPQDPPRAEIPRQMPQYPDLPPIGAVEDEDMEISIGHSAIIREENTEYRLLIRRTFNKELVTNSIARWRESLTWLPLDVPKVLELAPITSKYVPYYVFSARLDSTCAGTYALTNGSKTEPANTEISLKDDLNEILVCATTDILPNLMEELFDAKAFPITAGQNSNGALSPRGTSRPQITAEHIPVPPRHPYHAVRYRHLLFNPQMITESSIVEADIHHEKADEVMKDWLIHKVGPFLAEQEFKRRFGIESTVTGSTTTVRQMVRHLLLVPVYSTSYEYHSHNYTILVSGVNGHVVGQRMTWGTGDLGRAVSSLTSGISRIVSNNM